MGEGHMDVVIWRNAHFFANQPHQVARDCGILSVVYKYEGLRLGVMRIPCYNLISGFSRAFFCWLFL